ncbi:MAG: UDP-N-acetylglucosamine 2-epimerase (non-hydrolyzing) [Candidatus Kapabacteria bacterium]|nr:UDP-N-acetylglucosamine 2-epimerase (non-hydrolyzing) [Candidatus Kapabacteria bacterium]
MKRVISVVGARPNFMKVAPIHRAFAADPEHWDHRIVHTGQHYDAAMSDAFFRDLDMPHPAWFLGAGGGSHAEQSAKVMVGFEKVCLEANADYVIVVGDVNSTIACALVSVKMGIRTAHVEAGLRSFDRSMPEEINRLATDAIVDDLFVTEQSGLDHLLQEGVDASRVHFVGNTMIDSLHYARPGALQSPIHDRLGLERGTYCLVTMHRPSNVDDPEQLGMLIGVLEQVASTMPVVFPVHPRTRKNIEVMGLAVPAGVHMIDPAGYVDFLALMMHARVVLTDSGGIQEETTALGVPCITARTTTERPITVTMGTNVLVHPSRSGILDAMGRFLAGEHPQGSVPPLWDGHAAERIVAKIGSILGAF